MLKPYWSTFYIFQHANEDVDKMILGNKCDMEEKRVVAKERGEAVSTWQYVSVQSKQHINKQ